MDRLNSETCPVNKKMAALSEMAEAWWNRFHLAADDWGVFIAEPEWLKGRLWPYRESITPQKILSFLEEYEKAELIFCWEVRTVSAQCAYNGCTKYGFFVGWFEHQAIRYLSKRKFPAPPEENYHFKIIKQNDIDRVGSKNIQVIHGCAHSVRTVCAQRPPVTGIGTETNTGTEKDNTVLSLFENLWKSYPVSGRRGKQKAEEEFKKLKLKPDQIDKVMQSLESQITHKVECERDRKFCPEFPYLERWLKNRRWEDEFKAEADPLDSAEVAKEGADYVKRRLAEMEAKNEKRGIENANSQSRK